MAALRKKMLMSSLADTSRLPLTLQLDEVVSLRAQLSPDVPALIFHREPFTGTVVTWKDLEQETARFAGALRKLGVNVGDRVALILEDSPACLKTVFGIWRAGAAIVPIDARWGEQTLHTILTHVEPACIVGGQISVAETAPSFRRIHFRELESSGCAAPESVGDTERLAILAYTSGTTSNPKGVMIRHRHLRHAYSIARNHLFDVPPLRFGSVFRMGGLGVLGLNFLFPMSCGCSVVVLPELGLQNAHRLWQDVRDASIDFLYLVPTLVQLVTRVSHPVEDRRPILCVTGAAPISQELHRSFQDRFGHRLRNIYGITEASFGIFYGADEEDGRGAWHLGPVASPIRARLRDIQSGALIESAGEGLLEVSGPVLTDGYWKNPAATQEVFADGWLRTGDIAQRDDHDHYKIVGRLKDVVIRGGFNIHLEEVDQTLLSHPAVLGACTVGVKGTSTDEELHALVQVKPDFSGKSSELANWCRSRIGPSKTPNRIHLIRDELPRNSSGKIVRTRVLEVLQHADVAPTIERTFHSSQPG